jgi:NADH-quinone oxidoreductase subunit J
MITALSFYLFALVLTLSAGMVITAKNPVHSVLFLILSFFNAAGLFVLMGAEFIAMLLVIVYVGAVAVLFLFVVMMLDINFDQLRHGALRYAPIGMVLGGVLLAELVLLYAGMPGADARPSSHDPALAIPSPDMTENTKALGHVLYTHYILPFQVSGLILLTAMIGAIVLTLRHRPGLRRQRVADQNARKAADVLEMKSIPSGVGIKDV